MDIKIKQLLLTAALLFSLITCGCSNNEKVVVVYTSVDQVYSEKIFELFEEETGIKVKPVYDIEASKSIGLAKRIISEKDNPQADVFWNGEILQTLDLKANGVLTKADITAAKDLPASFCDSEGYWYGFGGRARVLIYNKTMITKEQCPKTLKELPTSSFIQNAGIAYPVFGTTSTQAAALYIAWGDTEAKEFFSSLKDSGISVLEGNSVVKDFVSQKKLYMGLTDTDDAFEAMETNKNLDIILLDQGINDIGTLVIPNTVAVINGAPHPEQADAFMEFILSEAAEQAMVNDGWIHIPVHSGVTPSPVFNAADIKIMSVDFNQVYTKLDTSKNDMTSIFVNYGK